MPAKRPETEASGGPPYAGSHEDWHVPLIPCPSYQLERLNCVYCSYANGLFAYATEIAARTEQHWCPIKHAKRLDAPHSRYWQFLDYGDAKSYRQQIDATRRDFTDLRH